MRSGKKTECFMELGETHIHGNSVEIMLIILSAMHPAKKIIYGTWNLELN